MSHEPSIRFFRVGGIPVSAMRMDDLLTALRRRVGTSAPGAFVVFRDAHGIVRSQDEPALRAAHETAWLVCPDGRPLTWIGRLRGHRGMDQVAGIESVAAVCRAGIGPGWRHYFYGGGPGVAARLAAEMSARAPGLRIAGIETPPFRPLRDDEVVPMRQRIRSSGADIVWVGLSTPKQELWMAEHAPALDGVVAMGVGAAFDVNAGTIPRAPRLLQRTGLEWLYRLAREPRRLAGRYLGVVPRFLLLIAREQAVLVPVRLRRRSREA